MAEHHIGAKGSIASVLPRTVELPGPMETLTGDWSLDVEDGRPVLEMSLTWSGDDAVESAEIEMVALVQSDMFYLAFLEVPLPEVLAPGERYDIRARYEWNAFLLTDLAARTYVDPEDARAAMNSALHVSQLLITRAEFRK